MKAVPLCDLFSITYGNKLDLNKMRIASGDNAIAFVNRTGFKNGVVAMVEPIPDLSPYPPGLLTVALGGSVLSTFLQVGQFYTGQNVAVAIPKAAMTTQQLLYYATAVRANKFRYSTCGREANRTFRTLLVPALSDVPPWLEAVDPNMFSGANVAVNRGGPLDLHDRRWKQFSLSNLFVLKKGRRLTQAERHKRPGCVPFIGAIDSNNGVSGSVDVSIHQGGTLTVNYNGAGVADSFYQPMSFWASDDVNVLYPKFTMTPEIGLFIATVIRKEKYRFSYGRKWHLERMTDSRIYLPADSEGQPDLSFMKKYIQALSFSSRISSFGDVIGSE